MFSTTLYCHFQFIYFINSFQSQQRVSRNRPALFRSLFLWPSLILNHHLQGQLTQIECFNADEHHPKLNKHGTPG